MGNIDNSVHLVGRIRSLLAKQEKGRPKKQKVKVMANKTRGPFYLIKITMIISVIVSTCVPALTTEERRNYHVFSSNTLVPLLGISILIVIMV